VLSSGRDRVTEHSVRRALQGVHRARRMPGGREEFIFKKSFGSEFDKIPETQGVHGRSKSSKEISSEGITQGVRRGQTYSKSKSSEEITLSKRKRDPR
jgi:hypothetical protein